MKRTGTLLFLAAMAAPALPAQTIPENSQAAMVRQAYRRTPSFRNDPFRHVAIPHWGFVFSAGLTGGNNALNAADLGALVFLADQDSLLLSDAIDAMSLIPQGSGLRGSLQGEGGFYLGGPFGGRVSLGLSARGTGYGAFLLDDGAVSLLRDGNGVRQDFTLGRTTAAGLATAEGGAHAMLRFGPFGSEDALRMSLGFGGRYLRPVFYAGGRSTLANGGTIRLAGDTVDINVAVERFVTRDLDETIRGSGIAGDFLLRFEWPTSGLTFEALVANLGSVDVPGVEHAVAGLNVATSKLDEVRQAVDTARFTVIDSSATVRVRLPRTVRFTASAWANRILQIDLSTTLPVRGDFDSPLAVDIGTTWRFIRTLPLRAGVVLGGSQGIGYSGGLAIEGRTLYFQLAAQSLGGFMRNATGAGGRVELGLFF